ncbi:MAG: Crp/Fnr family transcriptional regulator [Deltaproteobacteria bacterium]|nr:Crp/Fnr family transcriptional regulator [Deltaproteobacteria bacterium]
MLTIEKVMALSQVDLFAGLPGDSVAEIALIAEEVECALNQALPSGGEPASAMYVVITGRMGFQGADPADAVECGPGEAFGELCALDPRGETPCAVALEDSLLLKIEHENLFELISEDADIAQTVIRSLCRRLRKG